MGHNLCVDTVGVVANELFTRTRAFSVVIFGLCLCEREDFEQLAGAKASNTHGLII